MAKRGGFPGGGMPGNMANLMKQAQKMQRQMEEQAKEMETKEFTATAGGSAVEVTMSGKREVVRVKLSEEVVDPDDIEMLEDLIVAAAKETGKVVTVEEHSVIGGLGSAVCDVLSEKAPTKVLKIGVNDVFGESGPALELLKKYGLDTDGIYEKVKAFC